MRAGQRPDNANLAVVCREQIADIEASMNDLISDIHSTPDYPSDFADWPRLVEEWRAALDRELDARTTLVRIAERA